MIQVATFDGGLLLYILLCAVSVATGMGLVHLLRLRLPGQYALLLAPVLTLALWTVILGFGVAVGIPVSYLTAPLWVVTLGLAIAGLAWPWFSRAPRTAATAADSGSGASVSVSAGPTKPPVNDRGSPPASATAQAPGQGLLRGLWSKSAWLLVSILLPVAPMFPYFRGGLADYPGSNMPDQWLYVAYGQYLWDHSWEKAGKLAPLHQYAARSHHRYIAASMLGFLSPLLFAPGDTQAACGLLLALSLFVFAASCAFFGLTWGLKPPLLAAYLVLTVVSGWVFNMLWANNYDNALALAYLPALVGAIAACRPPTWSMPVVFGMVGAALIYCYPIVALIVLGGGLLVLVNVYWREGARGVDWLLTLGGGIAVTLTLAFPWLFYAFGFLRWQEGQESVPWVVGGLLGLGVLGALGGALFIVLKHVSFKGLGWISWTAAAGSGLVLALLLIIFRPSLTAFQRDKGMEDIDRVASGYFPGLLERGDEPSAFWGLGSESGEESLLLVRNLVGVLLSGLAAFGLGYLIWRRQFGLAAVVVLLTGAVLVLIVWRSYDYGAYKIILLGWWVLCFSVVAGLGALLGRLPGGATGPVAIILCALTVAGTLPFTYTGAVRGCGETTSYHGLSMAKFRTLEQLPEKIGNAGVLVMVNDWLANEWAVYYLRDRPIHIAGFRMYMAAGPREDMEPANVAWSETGYVLTDDTVGQVKHWQKVWSGGPYHLWKPDDLQWAHIYNVHTSETSVSKSIGPKFDVRSEDTSVDVMAGKTGRVAVTATFEPYPDGHEQGPLVCAVNTSTRYPLELMIKEEDDAYFVVPVEQGPNWITLRAKNLPNSTASASQAEPKFIIRNLSAVFLEDPPMVREVSVPIAGRTHQIAQAIASQAVVPPSVGAPVWPQTLVSLRLAAPEPQVVIVLPAQEFVYAIRLKYSYAETTGPADFCLAWKRKGQTHRIEQVVASQAVIPPGIGTPLWAQNSVMLRIAFDLQSTGLKLSTEPGEVRIKVMDMVHEIRIDPDNKPCVFTIEEIVVQVPKLPKGEMEKYRDMVKEVRKAVQAHVPKGAVVLVVTHGDDTLLKLPDRKIWHFPQNEDGSHRRYHPADSDEAIAWLKALRAKGAQFLVFPDNAFWWLQDYPALKEYLSKHHRLVVREENVIIFALR
jgi:hypothetical protein